MERAPTAAAPLTVDTRYTLERIEVHGNERTATRVVLRYVPFRAGDTFSVSSELVTLTRYRLLGTGFFKDVHFTLQKGTQTGRVVLRIELVERSTLVVNDVFLGLSADADTRGNARPLTAYAGLDVAETNLLGTGMAVGGAVGFADEQLALRLRFFDPAFLGTEWMARASVSYTNSRDFFGNSGVLYFDPALGSVPDFAVVGFRRSGGALAVGHDVGMAAQLWLSQRLEVIDARVPRAASHLRDGVREPLDFSIIEGRSTLSALRASLRWDTRDQPFLPTQGTAAALEAEVSSALLGSSYSYQRLDASVAQLFSLPSRHVIEVSGRAGFISGRAPFFEQYYIQDYSDFLASRVLGMNFDRRPSPNFFDTAIEEVRRGTYAASGSVEYRLPLYRGRRSVLGIDGYARLGLFVVGTDRELGASSGGATTSSRSGLARIPFDVTGNLGVRLDTTAGGISIAFSNLLGFIPLRGEAPR